MIHYSFSTDTTPYLCDICGAVATVRFSVRSQFEENVSGPGYLCSHHAAMEMDLMPIKTAEKNLTLA